MLKFLGLIASSFLSVFVAKSIEGAVQSSHAVAYRAVDTLTRKLLRKFAWTLIGICLFASGLVLSILDISEMWTGEITLSLGMKLILTAIGTGFLYAGLSAPKELFPKPAYVGEASTKRII